jgi:hypothetical protein
MRWSAWIVPGWVIGVRIRCVWPEGQGPIERREPGGRGATRYPPNRGAGPLSQAGKERQLSAERDSLKSMRAPSPGRAQVPRPIRPFPVSGSEPSRPPLQGTGTPRPGLGALPAAEVALGPRGRQLLPAGAQWGHVRSTCSWGSVPRDTRGKSVMILAFSVTPLGRWRRSLGRGRPSRAGRSLQWLSQPHRRGVHQDRG